MRPAMAALGPTLAPEPATRVARVPMNDRKVEGGKLVDRKEDRKEDRKLKEASQEFEAVFLSYILSRMRKTIEKSDFFGTGPAGETFESLLDERLALEMAKRGGIGLAPLLYNELYGSLHDGSHGVSKNGKVAK